MVVASAGLWLRDEGEDPQRKVVKIVVPVISMGRVIAAADGQDDAPRTNRDGVGEDESRARRQQVVEVLNSPPLRPQEGVGARARFRSAHDRAAIVDAERPARAAARKDAEILEPPAFPHSTVTWREGTG